LADSYFGLIYLFLQNEELPEVTEKAKKTLLMFENYYTENDLLYKVSLPRVKKEKRVRPQQYQLCILEGHTATLLQEWHATLGHFSVNKLIPTLTSRYFWPRILPDVKDVSQNCDICQKSKILTNPRTAPFTPLPVPTKPFLAWSIDHKTLSRSTAQGNKFILVFVDHFKRWTRFFLRRQICFHDS